jgi:hypothetical protein
MNILSSKKKTTVTKTETKTHKTDVGIVFQESWINGEFRGVSAHYPKDKKGDYWPVFLDAEKAFTPEAMKEYEGFEEFIEKYSVEIKSIEDIKKYPVFLAFHSGWVLFDENMKPIALPFIFSYIGSLREKIPNDLHYKKLIALLKKHPFILELEEEEIPYYNSDFYGQKGISHAKTLLSQKMYEKMYEACKKQEYWSVAMGEIMELCSYSRVRELNVYGVQISKLLKLWDDQKEKHDSEDEE